jgi:hypothetical protein
MWVRTAKRPWKPPRLSPDGKPFEPEGFHPGATVTWKQLVSVDGAPRDWVERAGQVWSDGWMPKSVWVIPFEPLAGERAVLVQQERYGRYEHSTWGVDNAATFKRNTERRAA